MHAPQPVTSCIRRRHFRFNGYFAVPDSRSFAGDILTAFAAARTAADRLSYLVDLRQRDSSGENSVVALAQPVSPHIRAVDRALSNTPAARTELISDKKSLFDAVPFHSNPFAAPLGI
jgi:hypothetical protein